MTGLGEAEPRNTNRFHAPGHPTPDVADRIRRTWVRLLTPARYERLEGSIRIAQIEIERRLERNGTETLLSPLPIELQSSPPIKFLAPTNWKDAALSLLSEARAALARGHIDQGWKLLHAARRMELLGLDDAELAPFAAGLRAESDKLNPWRQKATKAIVGTLDAPIPATAFNLWHAALIRDEHYNNQGYKDQLVRTQILFLATILAVVMTALMGLVFLDVLPLGELPLQPALPGTTSYTFLAVILFGNLGGTISAMLRASNPMSSTRIPEITSSNRVTLMRILMGGASAVVIHLTLQSQLTGIFNREVANTIASLTAQTTYVVAFVAGFSERLVLRAVEYVAGKQGTSEPDKDKSQTLAPRT